MTARAERYEAILADHYYFAIGDARCAGPTCREVMAHDDTREISDWHRAHVAALLAACDDAAAAEDLPLATVGETIHKATEDLGPIKALCGGSGSNLAENWPNVTCSGCRARRSSLAPAAGNQTPVGEDREVLKAVYVLTQKWLAAGTGALSDDLYTVDTCAEQVLAIIGPTLGASPVPASERGDLLTEAEQRDLRAAFERDRWAGEWNSLPTAVERILRRRHPNA